MHKLGINTTLNTIRSYFIRCNNWEDIYWKLFSKQKKKLFFKHFSTNFLYSVILGWILVILHPLTLSYFYWTQRRTGNCRPSLKFIQRLVHIQWMVTIATLHVTYGIFFQYNFFSRLSEYRCYSCKWYSVWPLGKIYMPENMKIDDEIEIELTLNVRCSSHNSVFNRFFLWQFHTVMLIYATLNLNPLYWCYVNWVGERK